MHNDMSETRTGSQPAREIRRYSNRRYYDTSCSRHVTLEGIRELVREGVDVRITDATSGEDITSRTLTQILLEYDTPKIAVLPSAMLHRLIRSSEPLLVEFMEQYFANAMQLFESSQQSLRDQWSRLSGLAGAPREMASWWQSVWGGTPPWPGAPPSSAAAEPPSEAPRESEGLRREVEELREQLARLRSELGGRKPDVEGEQDGS